MKKILTILCTLTLSLCLFGCVSASESETTDSSETEEVDTTDEEEVVEEETPEEDATEEETGSTVSLIGKWEENPVVSWQYDEDNGLEEAGYTQSNIDYYGEDLRIVFDFKDESTVEFYQVSRGKEIQNTDCEYTVEGNTVSIPRMGTSCELKDDGRLYCTGFIESFKTQIFAKVD